MEQKIMSNIRNMLEREDKISNVEMFYNLEQNLVVTYEYDNEKYIISQDIII